VTGWLQALDRRARLRARAGLTRTLRPRPATDATIDLAGNDYLGLSRHPEVVAAAAAALHAYGLGATGSRLVRGSTDLHSALERELADWLGVPAALVYSSGYLANLGALTALARPRVRFVTDAHNHASLIDGCRLARAEVVVTPHRDVTAVAAALAAAAAAGRPAVVVTESVFSVDGDLAPLAQLHRVARAHGAVLLVDEAHALGVVGPHGAGAVAEAGLAGQPDVVVSATLSKSLGGTGGVVAGPAELIRHLIDTSRPFIYDTALPPAVAAGARVSVGLARAADDLRAEVRQRATEAAARLAAAGLETTTPAAGVVSVTAPGPQEALRWAADCAARQVAVGCFRPPSTPDHRSRLRLTISAGLSRSEFEAALGVILDTAPAAARAQAAAAAGDSAGADGSAAGEAADVRAARPEPAGLAPERPR